MFRLRKSGNGAFLLLVLLLNQRSSVQVVQPGFVPEFKRDNALFPLFVCPTGR